MQIFECSCVGNPTLFFESTYCTSCGKLTGYSDHLEQVVAFDPSETELFFRCEEDPETLYKQCQNYKIHGVCNGMVRANTPMSEEQPPELCYACHFNYAIPNLNVGAHLALWQKLEIAKRRTLYTLKALHLPIPDREDDPSNGLSFSFLADRHATDHFHTPLKNHNPVFTGHENGEITINLAEADDVARAKTRVAMGEQYRTLLGHFRHEIGHFYWDQLVATRTHWLAKFREVFGDERENYQTAVERHYQEGPPEDWGNGYISAYATMHPWEDWAETWAHYLHVIDTLETAQSFDLNFAATKRSDGGRDVADLQLPQKINLCDKQAQMDGILATWMRFSVALNSLNRSMGIQDAYPFVLYPPIQAKLKLVHEIIHDHRDDTSANIG